MRVARLTTGIVLLFGLSATAQDGAPIIAPPPAAKIVLPGTPVSNHIQTPLPQPTPVLEAHPHPQPTPIVEAHPHPHADFFWNHSAAPSGDDCDRKCHPWCRGWFDIAFFIGKADNLPYVDRRFLYGVQAGAGYWIDDSKTVGLDAGFFSTHGTFRELYTNSMLVDSPVTLMTADFNVRAELYNADGMRIDGLFGYRYVQHHEDLFIGESTSTSSLSSRNHINAGQVGANVNYRFGPYFGEMQLTAGIGRNNITNDIDGVRIIDQNSCLVSEFGARVGYQLAERLWGTIGYSAYYFGNIDRPGEPGTSYLIHGLAIGIEKRF